MINWLLIKDSIVVAIIEKETNITEDDYSGEFDTVQEDKDFLFKVGDTFDIKLLNPLAHTPEYQTVSNYIKELPTISLTYWNATTKQDIAQLYEYNNFIVKAFNNEILELYESNVNGYAFVSRDINTNEIIDTYQFNDDKSKLIKNNEVETVFGDYNTIPDEFKPLLDDFEYKDKIVHWSNKSYGFIVEYQKY